IKYSFGGLCLLHRPKSLGVYFQQLSYCVTQFVEKEPKLASGVIMGLLRCWPITNSQKEAIFLGEVEEILEVISIGEFQKIMVAERALFLWNNDQILKSYFAQWSTLEINAQSHWNQAVLNLTLNVRKILTEMDDALTSSNICNFREEQEKSNLIAEKQRQIWKHLENTASLQPIAEKTAVLLIQSINSIVIEILYMSRTK
ncbi:protein phosphatase 2A regulatory B subunit family protein, partial [Striga asiatica]